MTFDYAIAQVEGLHADILFGNDGSGPLDEQGLAPQAEIEVLRALQHLELAVLDLKAAQLVQTRELAGS